MRASVGAGVVACVLVDGGGLKTGNRQERGAFANWEGAAPHTHTLTCIAAGMRTARAGSLRLEKQPVGGDAAGLCEAAACWHALGAG